MCLERRPKRKNEMGRFCQSGRKSNASNRFEMTSGKTLKLSPWVKRLRRQKRIGTTPKDLARQRHDPKRLAAEQTYERLLDQYAISGN